MRRRLMAGVAALVLLAGCTTGATTEPEDNPERQQAYQAAGIDPCPEAPPTAAVEGGLPELTLQCLSTGSESTLSGLAKGRPMVINFWAQWCGPCRAEAPFLKSVSEKTAGRVNFLGIDTVDPQPDLAIEFARVAGWTYPQLTDPDKHSYGPPLNVPGLPHTIFVDAEGRIVGQHVGQIASEEELDGYLRDLLGVDG
ncbi:redoxin family protein [Propionibacteriaceae bacterium Y1923]|uniref:TlpA family protein disulfide reductase n=1 Tax=Aestuariimicrobium sp. Y1814 TaxID=3418742 RepID=UPI003C249281